MRFTPRYRPASGAQVKITLVYADAKGATKTVPARSWVRNAKTRKELDSDWVFAGSQLVDNPFDKNAPKSYLANDGDVICVSNFESALLDLPVMSAKDDVGRSYEAWEDRIPPVGTEVTVVLEPVCREKVRGTARGPVLQVPLAGRHPRGSRQRLGLDLRFQDDLSPLFRPVAVGPLNAGNALCIQPMEGCDGTLDGQPDELTFRRYRRFGAGGAKLIWGEAAAVCRRGPSESSTIAAQRGERRRPSSGCSSSAARPIEQALGGDDDLIVGLQLTHSGRYSFRRPLIACIGPAYSIRRHSCTAARTSSPTITSTDWSIATSRRPAWRGVAALTSSMSSNAIATCSTNCSPRGRGRAVTAATSTAARGWRPHIVQRLRADVPGLLVASRLNVYDGVPYRPGADGIGEPAPWVGAASPAPGARIPTIRLRPT